MERAFLRLVSESNHCSTAQGGFPLPKASALTAMASRSRWAVDAAATCAGRAPVGAGRGVGVVVGEHDGEPTELREVVALHQLGLLVRDLQARQARGARRGGRNAWTTRRERSRDNTASVREAELWIRVRQPHAAARKGGFSGAVAVPSIGIRLSTRTTPRRAPPLKLGPPVAADGAAHSPPRSSPDAGAETAAAARRRRTRPCWRSTSGTRSACRRRGQV